MQRDLFTLWAFGDLTPMEVICLTSALNTGHKVALYSYDEPKNLPAGIELRDANAVIPRLELPTYKSGSVALGADIFRYKHLAISDEVWTDTDSFWLRPLEIEDDHIFGYESEQYVAIGVLGLPKDGELVKELNTFCSQNFPVPFWLSPAKKVRAIFQQNWVRPSGFRNLSWGLTGPQALTAFAKRLGLIHNGLPKHVFYPYHWTEADQLLEPGALKFSAIHNETLSIHLWGKVLRAKVAEGVPEGSLLWDAMVSVGIDPAEFSG